MWRRRFGGVPVLRDISFDLHPGELTVLAGENGAGKSTLMKIITGQLRADAGAVSVDGAELQHADPKFARGLGVGIVPQELAPYPEMTIYENLFVGRETRTRFGTLDRRRAWPSRPARCSRPSVWSSTAKTRMGNLPIALVQLVEIAKATTWGAKVLLLDEPTSAIPDREVERLYEVVRTLKNRAWRCSTRLTGWPRSKNSPTTSSCSATANWCSTHPWQTPRRTASCTR